MRNVQSRDIEASAGAVGALIDGLGGTGSIWPERTWPPLRLSDGLNSGSTGGHGPIRYAVRRYQPGHLVEFEFDPRIGLTGWHRFTLEQGPDGRVRLVHTLQARTTGVQVLLWPLATRWLHEALLHDLLDNAERALTGEVATPSRWSWWVRRLRAVMTRRRKP